MTSCVIKGTSLFCSKPQFLICKMGIISASRGAEMGTYLTGSAQGLADGGCSPPNSWSVFWLPFLLSTNHRTLCSEKAATFTRSLTLYALTLARLVGQKSERGSVAEWLSLSSFLGHTWL